MKLTIFSLLLLVFCNFDLNAQSDNVPSAEKNYAQIALERAEKIVNPLNLESEKRNRILELVSGYYQTLHSSHEERDVELRKIDSANEQNKLNIQLIKDSTNLEIIRKHLAFEAALSADLNPDQIEQIKNGLTYNVLPLTYKMYQELYPDLKDDEKRYILIQLTEAREFAMQAGSSKEKHEQFGKYKGRINNYLSKAGYNAKEAEAALKARKASSQIAN